MSTLAAELKKEIRRIARKELKSENASTKKAVAQHRRDIADLKRRNQQLERTVAFLQKREGRRLANSPSADVNGVRFSVRSLKAQRRQTGLSQADYAALVGVSKLTIYNWESGNTKPGDNHLAKLVSLRGLGKREAWKRLELLA